MNEAQGLVNRLIAERDQYAAQKKASEDTALELEQRLASVKQRAADEEAAYATGKSQHALEEKNAYEQKVTELHKEYLEHASSFKAGYSQLAAENRDSLAEAERIRAHQRRIGCSRTCPRTRVWGLSSVCRTWSRGSRGKQTGATPEHHSPRGTTRSGH